MLLGLVPSVIRDSQVNVQQPTDLVVLYQDDLPSPQLFSSKCERECSIGTMRRLNNYMRCTMGESRLSALALMHIKYDMPVNLDEIVNLFEGLHPRMMQLTSLVYDYQQIE